MSVIVKKLPNEPILIVTVEGQLDAGMVRDLYQEIGLLTKDMQPPIYRITDVRNMTITFMDLMGVIQEGTKDMPGTTADTRISHMFVGKDKFAKIARDVLQRINPDNHPMLDTMEEALDYIRWKSEHEDETDNKNVSNP